MSEIKLLRRRFIPNELIKLDDDVILYNDEQRIVTRWDVLTPRHDFTHGVSCYYINDGIKVSRFLNAQNELVYWYCDIIETELEDCAGTKTYTFKDLLADVIIYPDGRVRVDDLDEVALALEQNMLPKALLAGCLKKLSALLEKVYDGRFEEYKQFLVDFGG